MNFKNIDSTYNIAPWQISFTKLILKSDGYSFYRNDWFAEIIQSHQFYLVNESTFCLVKDGSYHKSKRKEDKIDNRNSIPSISSETDTFSCFIRNGLYDKPEIYICPEAILKYTKNEEEVMILLAKVLIHELSYADINEIEHEPKDEFYNWMKEACAIEMTLNFFKSFEENHFQKDKFYLNHHNIISPFEFITEYCFKKTDIYKLGFYFHINQFHSYSNWNDYDFTKSDKKNYKEKWLHYLKSEVLNNELSKNKSNKDDFKDITRRIIINEKKFQKI